MDPLSYVYQGRDNTGAAAVMPNQANYLDRHPNALADKKSTYDPLKDGLGLAADLSKAWDVDVPDLEVKLSEYMDLRKSYERERDPSKKAAIMPAVIKAKTDLSTGIKKSAAAHAAYKKDYDGWNKDKGFFLPENTPELLDAYSKKKYYEREENAGVKAPTNIDVMSEFDKAFKKNLGKPDVIRVGQINPATGTKVTKETTYYTQDQIDIAAKNAMSSLKGNVNRAWTAGIQAAAMNNSAAAAAFMGGPDALEAYKLQAAKVFSASNLGHEVYSKMPMAPRKASSSSSAAKTTIVPYETIAREDGALQTTVNYKGGKPIDFTFEQGGAVINVTGTPQYIVNKGPNEPPLLYVSEANAGTGKTKIKSVTAIPLTQGVADKIKALTGQDYFEYLTPEIATDAQAKQVQQRQERIARAKTITDKTRKSDLIVNEFYINSKGELVSWNGTNFIRQKK